MKILQLQSVDLGKIEKIEESPNHFHLKGTNFTVRVEVRYDLRSASRPVSPEFLWSLKIEWVQQLDIYKLLSGDMARPRISLKYYYVNYVSLRKLDILTSIPLGTIFLKNVHCFPLANTLTQLFGESRRYNSFELYTRDLHSGSYQRISILVIDESYSMTHTGYCNPFPVISFLCFELNWAINLPESDKIVTFDVIWSKTKISRWEW